LESIPGFKIGLSPEEMVAQVREIGACLAGQTEDLAPADRKLYALRDATATVSSLPLLVSSILSKKLAGGAAAFLFDVKVGGGALTTSEAEAHALAVALVNDAAQNGRRAVAVLSDMSQPLGDTVGNALEVAEAIRTLTPSATPVNARFRELCLSLAAEGMRLARIAEGDAARERAERLLEDGAALTVFRRIVLAQGGDVSVVDDPGRLPHAPAVLPVPCRASGYVAAIDAAEIGNIVVSLGGGRARKEDTIDPRVGLIVQAAVGQPVAAGDVLAEVHARTMAEAQAARERVRAAYRISQQPAATPPLLLGQIASP
jgi:pyrimidine-nucleoside phosphorylase